MLSQLVAIYRSPQMFSSTLQVLADQSQGFEGFSAPREALGKGVPVPQGRIERQSGVPRDEGDVGFIRIVERESYRLLFHCFFCMILSSLTPTMASVATRNSQEFRYSHRLLARRSQCHGRDFKHRVGVPRGRQER